MRQVKYWPSYKGKQTKFTLTGDMMSKGIDYGNGTANRDNATGIRYGVIPFHDVLQAWCDSSEAVYPEPETDEDDEMDFVEPLGHEFDDSEYTAHQYGDSPDIFIVRSPFYTRAQFCSPCAPGACYLRNPCEDGEKAYCFGHDWFEDGRAPYPVYRVSDDSLVESE